jgi:AcrR family transcriptional regulator
MARNKVICDKRQIIDLAFRVINNEGEAALSARRLAKELNMSAMTLYNYVENIDAIKKEVVLQGFNILYKKFYARLNSYKQENGGIAAAMFCKIIAQALFEFGNEYSGVYKLIFLANKSKFIKDAEIRPFYGFFMRIYTKTVLDRVKREDLKKAFQMFEFIIHGLILENLEGISRCPMEKYCEYIDFYINRLIETVIIDKGGLFCG